MIVIRRSYVLFLLLALTACKPKPAQEHYPFHGMILTIEPRGHSALIQHEDVPGLMKGMTMPFTIKDDKVLAALKPGDVIQATLIKQDYESWLDDIKVLSHNDLSDDKPAIATPLQLPKAGAVVPDFPFINQDGKRGHFAQFQGAPVLLTFIYTRCPLPDFCPRMNANLLTIAQKASAPSLRLLSISFDPDHDTPEVLRSYSRRWVDELPPAQRSHWQFIAPDKKDLPELFKFFALTAQPDEGFITHSLSTALIGSDGKLAGWYEGNQWTTEEVLKDIAVITAP